MASSKLLEVGTRAPAFGLKDQDGTLRRLSHFKGRPVVLYFYPRDMTSGCTAQACEFRDQFPDFAALEVPVLGISPDAVDSHRKFADKHDLPFTLLADPKDDSGTPAVCEKYGVWQEKSMYGRRYKGVVRTTYLISPTGRITHRFDKVKPKEHAALVLQKLHEIA
ncbi:MAG: thioredoxin-dependent thiol peroxidase [Planctomycetes bacterium]|nr:thioredoxin-dependent thiol peroxidase [Planctomycetota bacterium]NOG54065.1 thioredoxin-dependent thiol peroxidase [Planctomycetota bacterium]